MKKHLKTPSVLLCVFLVFIAGGCVGSLNEPAPKLPEDTGRVVSNEKADVGSYHVYNNDEPGKIKCFESTEVKFKFFISIGGDEDVPDVALTKEFRIKQDLSETNKEELKEIQSAEITYLRGAVLESTSRLDFIEWVRVKTSQGGIIAWDNNISGERESLLYKRAFSLKDYIPKSGVMKFDIIASVQRPSEDMWLNGIVTVELLNECSGG